ncbi:MAG: hypothetical protein ACK4UJ_11520 [Leptonema sp. (in: bacteria)]
MKLKVLLILLIIFIVIPIYSKEKNLGIGISILYPTGLTLKYKFEKDLALESVLGFSMYGRYFHIGLLKDFSLINNNFYLYTGGSILWEEKQKKEKFFKGVFVKRKGLYGGARMPFGFLYYDSQKNFEIFGEVSLNLLFFNSVEATLGLALGMRVYL